MTLSLRGIWVWLAMSVTLTNFAIPAVDDCVATLIFCDLLCFLDRFLLGVIARGVSFVTLASNRPRAVRALHNVLVCHKTNWGEKRLR